MEYSEHHPGVTGDAPVERQWDYSINQLTYLFPSVGPHGLDWGLSHCVMFLGGFLFIAFKKNWLVDDAVVS